VHVSVGPVTAIVPGPTVSNAGNSEETWRHPLVLNAGRRLSLLQKFSRRIVAGVWNRLDGEVCPAVFGKEAPPRPPSGEPASSEKIETGISTLAPVLGITYLRHSVAWAKQTPGSILSTSAIRTRNFMLAIPFRHEANPISSYLFQVSLLYPVNLVTSESAR
jgi:hypothetical protein